MLNKKVSILYLFLTAILVSGLTVFILSLISQANAHKGDIGNASVGLNGQADYNIQRDRGNYKFISPIISVEPKNESDKYAAMKTEMQEFIDKEKGDGSILSASVYLRDFSKGEWMAVNAAERYNPGSLLKVGVLITYLRMAENDTNLLNRQVVYQGEKGFVYPVEHYKNDTVIEGHKYRINDLLSCMIRNSDNRATVFLEDHMDTGIFKKEFEDLGITQPRFNDPTYSLNVKEYSMMFKALYNAGYLRKRASESALALLAESTFRDGLLRELPANVVVAHKYGEAGNQTIHELHESGIIYLNNNPYMITVMTSGTDWDKLSATIGHISKIAYDNIALSNDRNMTYQSTIAK